MNNAIYRIKILTAMQLKEKLKRGKKLAKQKTLVQVIVYFAIFLIITFAISAVLFLMKNVIGLTFVNKTLLLFFIVVMQVVSIISCTNGFINSLYLSKDNPILLSFPAKHNEVFISKLLVYFVFEFVKNILVTIPFLIAFGIISQTVDKPTAAIQEVLGQWPMYKAIYFPNIIMMVIILPIIPVFVGAALSLPIMYLRRIFTKYPILQVIGLIVLLIPIIFLLIYGVKTLLPDSLAVIANINYIDKLMKNTMEAINERAYIYKNLVEILYYRNTFNLGVSYRWVNIIINYGIVIAFLFVFFVFIFFITMPTYFKIACHSSEQSTNKAHKRAKQKKQTLFQTFVNKELKITIRNFNTLISNYILAFIFPMIVYVVSSAYDKILKSPMGEKMVIAFITFIGLALLTASNTASATAITTEGSEFTLLKTAPSKTRNMAWAKIVINLVFATTVIIISFIILSFATSIPPISLWLACITFILINSAHIFWSFQLDIRKPKLREYATTGNLNENKNVSRSITIGLVISLVSAILILLLLLDSKSPNLTSGWIRIILIAIAFFLARLYLFNSNLKVHFDEIEL